MGARSKPFDRIIQGRKRLPAIRFSWGAQEGTMKLTVKQERALQNGQAVEVTVAGAPCVLLRKDIYERGEAVDYSPWTKEEMNLLAAEAVDLLAGDGLDEPDDA
jgi:hypothetical protein